MFKIKSILIISSIAIALTGCIQFKPMALYSDESGIEVEAKNINGFTALNIFNDEITTEAWGMLNTKFQVFKPEKSITFKGNGSIHCWWDKISDNSQYIGMGFGWDGWSGKNLEDIIDNAAIQFYIRNAKDSVKAVVIVGLIEDYAGTVAVCPNMTESKFYGGGRINETWKKVTVPLTDFTINKDIVDYSNVKQFIMQFEVKGDVYIDEIEIVPYTNPNAVPKPKS